MITDCGGGDYSLYGLEDRGFLLDVVVLMIYFVIPTAVGYTLWRIFVTNRTGLGGTTILGLDENSATYKEMYDHGISWRKLFLYGLTAVVFGFEVFRYLSNLMTP